MSTATHQSRPGRRIGPARSAQVLLAGLVGLLVVVLGGSPASAYWSSTGAGTAAGQTGTLAAPVGVTVPANAVTDVPISWTAGTGGVAPQGYYVTRQQGATTDAACLSSPTALITTTSCEDSDVADGDYSYVVTAVFRSWTAAGAASSTLTVVNPARLGFASPPTDTTAGGVITPPVVVRLLSAGGSPVAYAGLPITLSIGVNPAVGSLSGLTTVDTAADGTATFSSLSVDRAGVGYTLVATSPALTSATSVAFNVLPPPPLGDASSYSVLGGGGVVNTLGSRVSGDLGTGPGQAATGFGPSEGTVGGDIHLGDADAVKALAAADRAYTDLRALHATTELSGTLGGLTLAPGVYHSTAALSVTGILTLDGGADDVFVFQVDAALDTAAADQVVLTGGARASNVYWVVDGAVTLGAGTLFKGTILAHGAITIGLATEVIGRAFATGAVTMANNVIRFTDALPPTLTITGGATVVTKDTTPDISGTTNAPVGTAVKVTVDGQTLSTTVQTGGSWTVTAAALPASSYAVVAQVRDAAGNATRASQTIVVEVNPPPVDLRSTASYSVLAGVGGVTNTGLSHATGDVGATGVIVGFSQSMTDGTIHENDAAAATAQVDLQAAITDAQGRAAHTQLAGDLGGRTFHVGVHRSTAAVGLTGTVTLDGEGDPNAVFIFQIGAALTGAASCQVNLVNGAQAANVFWVVNGAAGTGASCSFTGTIMATGAITLGDSTSLAGRALSQDAVTMASNTITTTSTAPAARSRRSVPSADPTPSDELTTSVEPTSGEATPTPTPTPTLTPSPTPTTTPSPTPTPGRVDQDGAP